MHRIYNPTLIIMLIAFTLFHLTVGATLGLGEDESYYWVWSKHLALSYYDHPPMIAYLIALSTHLFGDTPFAVRFFNILMIPVTSILIYLIALNIYKKESIANGSVFLINIVPMFFLGSILTAPDMPMLFCYTLGLYLFVKIVYESKSYYWYYLGLVTGLGLLSKYMILFLYLAVFLYLILDEKQRFWFKKPQPYIAFVLSLVMFTPVIIWNYQHQWVSFIFQFYSRHLHHANLLENVIRFLVPQLILITPLFFVALIIIVIKKFFSQQERLLLCFGLPPLIVFAIASIFSKSVPTWAIMSYVPLFILFVANAQHYYKTKLLGILFSCLLAVVAITQAYYPIIKFKPLKNDLTIDLDPKAWINVAQAVDEFMAGKGGDWFVFSHRYQIASQLAFAVKNKYQVNSLPVYAVEGNKFWQNEAQLHGKNGLFVTNDYYYDDPTKMYACEKWLPYKTVDITRANLVYRKVFLYQCINYQGLH